MRMNTSTSNHHPRLVLIMGRAGSGKSTIARHLLEVRPMAYLNKDTVWEPLLETVESRAEYLAKRDAWYELLYRLAEENLAAGISVLLDAPHVRQAQDPAWGAAMRSLACRAGSAPKCVYCYCTESTLKQRLVDRGLQRDAWKISNWRRFLEQEPVALAFPLDHVMVDTDRRLDECLRTVLGFLQWDA
jgi:predicted kinase